MEKSLVVYGKNLEAALDKGALLLHCPTERIAYEVLQEPKPGRSGRPGVPCRLRVTPVAPSAEEMDSPLAPSPQEERLPWQEWDLEVMPSPVFLLSLQNLMSLVPRAPLFPEPNPLPDEFPEPREELIGDITSSHGTFCHDGDLRIHGTVRKGARVRAAGSIHVIGEVETAFLDAGGDILITGGLLGTLRSRCGSIACKFAQGARMDAGGDITVQESCMHSYLNAGRSIFVGGILLGGTAYAQTLLETDIAGSDSGVPTLLIAGPNKRLMEEAEAIRDRAAVLVGELHEIDGVCRELLPSEEAGQPLPVEERLRLWRALIAKTRVNDALAQLSRQKSRLLGMINGDRAARICVPNRAYPNVKVSVDGLTMDLTSLTQFVTFSKDYDLGELRITPYR